MTYLICPRCNLTTYSRPLWVALDACPECGRPAHRLAAEVTPISSHPRFRAGHAPASDRVQPNRHRSG